MPWRRLRFGGYSPGCLVPCILFGLLIIQDISGHPIPCHDYHSYYNSDGIPYPYHGETCHDPRASSHGIIVPNSPPLDYWNYHPTTIVPEQRRVPKPIPVPIYYSVPIPWPTPSNGTNVTPPLPLPPSIDTYVPPPLGEDSFPVYIPIPRFQYVPLYYDVSSGPPTNLTPPPCNPKRPEPKPKPPTKPDKPSKPRDNAQPPTKPPQGPKKPLPQDTKTPINPLCEDSPPPVQPIPRPSHTWVPPPKNLPNYIPLTPKDLPTRSLHYPRNRPVDPYPNYERPYPTDPFYQKTYYNPYDYQYSYYVPFNHMKTTYGPNVVTITDPSSGDGYITTGPDYDTFTTDVHPLDGRWGQPPPIWYKPSPPPPVLPSPQPFPPSQPPFRPTQSPPSDPVPRFGIPPPPGTKPADIDLGYVIYDPETFTIKENDADADKAIIFGPNVVGVVEKNSPTDNPKGNPPDGYVEDEPDIITFSEPDSDFRYAPANGPILEEPAPSAYASLLPGGNKGLSNAPSR